MLALGEYRRGASRRPTAAPRPGESGLEEGVDDRTPEEEPEELGLDETPDSGRSLLGAVWAPPADGRLMERGPAEDLFMDGEPTDDLGYDVTLPFRERLPGETVRPALLRPMDPVDRSLPKVRAVARDSEPNDDLSSVRSNDRICGRAPLPRELVPLNPLRLMTGLTSGCRAARLICPRLEAC